MKRRIWIWVGSSLFLVAGLAYVATGVEAYTTVAYVCENTGSFYGYHLWPGGFKTRYWARTSPLESYLAATRMNRPIQHRWSRCAYMGTTILGKHIAFADGPVGGMASLRNADQQLWIEHHGRSEIVGLYDFFRTANLDESMKRAHDMRRELHPDDWAE